jgi:ATP-binding cassette subfamily C (CFTR/MRP) protein 4
MNDALFFAVNISVSLLIFLIHVFSGGTLTLTSVYTTIVLVNAVQCGKNLLDVT